MNETQVKMMEEYGVLVLPDGIDHVAYELVIEALYFAKHCERDRVVMYCAGMGGELNSALAICDVIQGWSGVVVGLLPGQADSCHADVWLACHERYVYPMGHMGLHQTKYVLGRDTNIDARYAYNLKHEQDQYNRRCATLLANACTSDSHDVGYWLGKMSNVGASGVIHYDADSLIAYGMAKGIAEFDVGGQGKPSPYGVDMQSLVDEHYNGRTWKVDISHLSKVEQERFRQGGEAVYFDADGKVQFADEGIVSDDDVVEFVVGDRVRVVGGDMHLNETGTVEQIVRWQMMGGRDGHWWVRVRLDLDDIGVGLRAEHLERYEHGTNDIVGG